MDIANAESILRTQFSIAKSGAIDKSWARKFANFSDLCEASGVKTHIAFLATTLLAKSLSKDVDLYAIKPNFLKRTRMPILLDLFVTGSWFLFLLN